MKPIYISEIYRSVLPDFTKLSEQLLPFGGAEENDKGGNVLFSPDGSKLYVSSNRNELVCYDTNSWKELWRCQSDGTFGIPYIDVGHEMIWLERDWMIRGFWNMNTGKRIHQLSRKVKSLSPKRTYYNNVEYARVIFINYEEDPEREDYLNCIAHGMNEDIIAMGGKAKDIRFMDLSKWELINTIPLVDTNDQVKQLFIHPNGIFLSVVLGDRIHIYKIDTKEKIAEFQNDSPIIAAIWSPEGKYYVLLEERSVIVLKC